MPAIPYGGNVGPSVGEAGRALPRRLPGAAGMMIISALNAQPARSMTRRVPSSPGRECGRKAQEQALGKVGAQRQTGQRPTGGRQAPAVPDHLDELIGSPSRSTMLPASPPRRRRGRGRCPDRPGRGRAHRWRRRRTRRHADPCPARARSSCSLSCGVAWATNSSTPASAATVAAVSRLSPVTITVRTPMRRSSSHCARIPGRMTS